MTAPRPGDPDFLVQTIESWLGAFPDVDTPSLAFVGNASSVPSSAVGPPQPLPTSSRLRLVVYTHFATHLMFDLARQHFASSAKAAHYISWQRDPHALAPGAHDRLDQRLHVARGLAHAAGLGGAYVLLTEDDFPLCEDERAGGGEGARSWAGAWTKLQAALVATNELMPDAPVLDGAAASEASMGHCGLFLATGGSGLAIRTPLAARLPALLLGADDPHGLEREAAAGRRHARLGHPGLPARAAARVRRLCARRRTGRRHGAGGGRAQREAPEQVGRRAQGQERARWDRAAPAAAPRVQREHAPRPALRSRGVGVRVAPTLCASPFLSLLALPTRTSEALTPTCARRTASPTSSRSERDRPPLPRPPLPSLPLYRHYSPQTPIYLVDIASHLLAEPLSPSTLCLSVPPPPPRVHPVVPLSSSSLSICTSRPSPLHYDQGVRAGPGIAAVQQTLRHVRRARADPSSSRTLPCVRGPWRSSSL